MRVSSITTSQLVDQFRDVLRHIAPELHSLACHGMAETQFRSVERLAGEAESFEYRAKL